MAYLDLIRELYTHSQPAERCPHLAHTDKEGCYCQSPELSSPLERLAVCDHYSLPLWCLDHERWEKCHFYPKASDTR